MKNFENLKIRKRMLSLGVTAKELAEEMNVSYSAFSHWILSPMTELHKKLTVEALDRIEAERNGK